jgi:hypothetical protein
MVAGSIPCTGEVAVRKVAIGVDMNVTTPSDLISNVLVLVIIVTCTLGRIGPTSEVRNMLGTVGAKYVHIVLALTKELLSLGPVCLIERQV